MSDQPQMIIQKIVGHGSNVDVQNKFPAVCMINIIKNGRKSICTGTLISDQWIITAGHCLFDKKSGITTEELVNQLIDDGRVSVIFNNGIEGKEREKTVVEFKQVPNRKYLSTSSKKIVVDSNDIILLRLESRVTDITPLNIANVDFNKVKNEICTVVGYGKFSNQENESISDVRRFAEVRIIQSTKDMYVSNYSINQGQDTGTCSGDSGGPLFLKDALGNYQLIGTVRAGDSSCALSTRKDLGFDFINIVTSKKDIKRVILSAEEIDKKRASRIKNRAEVLKKYNQSILTPQNVFIGSACILLLTSILSSKK